MFFFSNSVSLVHFHVNCLIFNKILDALCMLIFISCFMFVGVNYDLKIDDPYFVFHKIEIVRDFPLKTSFGA